MYTQLNSNNKTIIRGFTLIELMVALSIFTMVMVVAVGAMLSALNANKRARAVQAVMMNVNYAIETMARNIRYGSNYTTTSDCISFRGPSGVGAYDTYKYCHVLPTGDDPGTITLEINENNATPIVSMDEITISDLQFSEDETGRDMVSIYIRGEVLTDRGIIREPVPFSLRTAVSSRVVPN